MNENIVANERLKDQIERELNNTLTDYKLNDQSVQMRQNRPTEEKVLFSFLLFIFFFSTFAISFTNFYTKSVRFLSTTSFRFCH